MRIPLLTITLALLGSTPAGAAETPAATRPNILFCIADDASYAHFAANGCPWVRTPAFDRVAREGLLFQRAYTPNAKCAPSRACVLTGRNSWQLESAGNHGGHYPAGYTTFMEALGRHGYHVGFTGKGWAPGDPGRIDGRPRELTGPAFDTLRTPPPTTAMSSIDYAANFAAFLREKPRDRPFCFWFGALEPHRPYAPNSGASLGGRTPAAVDHVEPHWPDDDIVRNDLLDYGFEIEYFDRQLGRLLAELERAGELDHTIIVVTSDNGMPFPRAKGTAYELSTHMPLAIRWGRGVAHPGRTVGGYVSFIDFAPTFLELAGLTAAGAGMAPVQGRSLRPIFAGEPGADGADHLVLGQERHDVGRPDDTGYPIRGLLRGGFLYLRNFEPGRWPMCDPITGYLNTDGGPTKTLILTQNRAGVNHWIWELNFGRRPAEELYDLRADPACLYNLATESAQQSRRAAMWRELSTELIAQRDPRMAGQGDVFDHYPNASSAHDFYTRRILRGERVPARWVEESDFEGPGFDPERPLAPVAVAKP